MAAPIKRAYGSDKLSEQQTKDLNNARSRAVYQAWSQEKEYVKQGKGTRDWTPEQQRDIVNNHKVGGFEGHHMRSVSNGKTYDEKMKIAEDKNNIQFLEKTKENNEHIKAHEGDTKNRTNGYYDVNTGKTKDFGNKEPQPPKAEKLSNPVMKQNKEETKSETKAESKENAKTDRFGIDMSKAEQKSEHTQNKGKSR